MKGKVVFFTTLMLFLLFSNSFASKCVLQINGKHLEREGQYLRWDFSREFPSGSYKVYIRAKGKGKFCLFQIHNDLGNVYTLERMKYRIDFLEYQDIYLGTMLYDGSYRLTLADWSSGGMWIDSIYLVPVSETVILPERPKKASKPETLADFESKKELSDLTPNNLSSCLSKKFVSSGKYSLKLLFLPGKGGEELGLQSLLYQGVTFNRLKVTNWEPYDALAFDFYNPQIFPVRVTLQIQDKDGFSIWPDAVLESGWNHIKMPTQRLKYCFLSKKEGCSESREIDLRRIAFLKFAFTTHSENSSKTFEERTFWLDNLRLISVDIDGILSESRNELAQVYEELSSLIKKAEDMNIRREKAEISLALIDMFGNLIPEDYLLEKKFVDYCIRSGEEAIVELKRNIKEREKPLSKFKLGKLRIKDGNFYVHDKPVFFFGPNVWATEGSNPYTFWFEKHLPLFSKFGFNMLYVPVCPGVGKGDLHIKILEEDAKKYNMGMEFLLAYHFLSPHFYEKHPEIKRPQGTHMLPFRIDHFKTKEILEKELFQRAFPLLRDKSALFAYCLGNEPMYEDYCNFTEYDLGKFREWLGIKYKDIEELNLVWATEYRDFKQIDFPSDKATKIPFIEKIWDNRAMWYDWMVFNQDRLTDFFRWVKETAKGYDPETPVYIKVVANLWKYYFRSGVNFEDLAGISDIVGGGTCWVYEQPFRDWAFQAGNTTYSLGFGEQAFFCDLYRSLYPKKPILNPEWTFAMLSEWPKEGFIRTTMWHAVVHGLRAGSLWGWYWIAGDCGLWGIPRQPSSIKTMAETVQELNHLAPYLVKFPPREGDFAILWSNPSYLQDHLSYRKTMWEVYEGAYFLDAPIKFISERQVASGNLGKYKILILPEVNFVEEKTYHEIKSFVFDGGTVVLVPKSLEYNPYGRRRKALFFAGLKKSVNHALLKGKVEVAGYGKGKVFFAHSLNVEEYRELFDGLFDKLGVFRPIRVSAPLIESRTVRLGEDKFLTYLINTGLLPTKVNLRSDLGRIDGMKDMVNNDYVKGEIELTPLNPILLEIKVSEMN